MDPQAFWLHEGKLFMAKREVVNRGWLSDAQSSKKLKGRWKKASSLGMRLSAKYSTLLAMWSDRFPFGNTFVLRSNTV